MLFTSREYLLFLLAVFVLYWLTPWQRARVWLLLVASVGFYSAWSHWLALLVFASATLDWLLALAIESARSVRLKRLLLGASLSANLGLLCYFKYVNFFLDSLGQLARACGVETLMPLLNVLVPIGLSFYTFEAISYIVDVYRSEIRAERRLSHLLLFILFFPHLVAGPIVRGRDFLPQIARRKRFNWVRVQLGVQLILLGLLKKWVIADRMAMFVEPVFADPAAFKAGACWIAAFAYALQVYGDFSGYSDMAMGSAYLFGYHLSVNFRTPFLSANITDFWRRWHVSLSSWLRDYLFYPLGGSRRGEVRTAFNLMAVMVLCGLWHGASWNCLVWGFLNSVLMIAHRVFALLSRGTRLGHILATPAGIVGRIAFTFTCFSLSLVVFRTTSLADSLSMFGRLFMAGPGQSEPLPAVGFVLTLALVLGLDLLQLLNWRKLTERAAPWLLGTSYAAILCVTMLFAPGAAPPFIYFQF